ncbi:MAG TPA: alginate lyase family protein, partial [Gemmatimonadaceae bacterium]|nr:alginate lyase family protein [Gemmatimonadaceae bacterium]
MRLSRLAAVLLAAIPALGQAQQGRPQPRTLLLRPEALAEARQRALANDPAVRPAYEALLRDADSALGMAPVSVTQKQLVPASGDKHDFMSLGPYWWPDTTKPGGLPWVRRDGIMNPQTRVDHDGLRFGRLTDAVEAMALAYHFTGDRRYPARAAVLLRTWFLAPATRMNPNLNFAQGIPGVSPGRGIGILDFRHATRLLDAVRLFDGALWSETDARAFDAWWRAYRDWLRDSENGKDERDEPNNHGTWYAAQAAGIALYLGDSTFARALLDGEARARIDAQLAADGSQPLELDRTRPLNYHLFNLEAHSVVAELARHVGIDLWRHRSPKGASLREALRFVAPYSDTTVRFPKPDAMGIPTDTWLAALARGRRALGDPVLVRAYARRPNHERSRYSLLYPTPTRDRLAADSAIDAAMTHAATVMRRAATELDPERGFPRITDSTGAWTQRSVAEWTAGFFPGTLWYQYQLTGDSTWKPLAEKWTWGGRLAGNARRTNTHDIGFLIHDSFGNGFLLTGEPRYRDVVLEGSRALVTRFNPTVGAIKSWDTERANDRRRTWKYPVIVDNLMNLEMLLWAARNGGDTTWARIAERHALTSARAHVRADGSTAHAALFDPATGRLEQRVTWQGYADTSAWARGQAWAVHGFATVARLTGNAELLRTARRTADWLVAHLPAD